MSATKAQINWSACLWDSIPLTRITTAMVGLGGSLLKFKGDTDLYPSIIACVDQEPHFSFTSADVGTFMGFVPGVSGTATGTLNDAKAATGGGCVFTGSNAVFENSEATGAHAAYASVTGTFQLYASDGLTPPLTLTRV